MARFLATSATLNQFIIERQAEIPGATGEFSRLLHHIGIAAKKVHREVNNAGLVDILGKVGSINVQGEDQQKLDVYIKNTAEIVKVAKAFGADVEAELGRVGFASTVADQNDTDKYTKPEVAAAFCEQSGCSSVAVAIGSAHGFYKETPKLDIERLKKINAATDVPLVLHGGSGIPNDQLEVAFREGINKFNVGTEFFYLYYQTMKKFCEAGHPDFFDLPLEVQNALENYLRQKMQLSKFQA